MVLSSLELEQLRQPQVFFEQVHFSKHLNTKRFCCSIENFGFHCFLVWILHFLLQVFNDDNRFVRVPPFFFLLHFYPICSFVG
jgi:hypothetical protein